MTVSVEKERYLGVACGDGEQIVFDRNRDEFHLLRGVAARIWETICDGGTFSFSDFEAAESVKMGEFTTALREMEKAELVRIENLDQESGAESSDGKTKIDRRAWISLTGKAAAVATVLPLVMTLAAPKPGLATAKKKNFPHHGGDESNGDHHDVSPFCKDDSESNGDDYHRYSGGDESGGDDKCDVSTGDDHGDDHSNGDHHGGDNWWDKSNDESNNQSNSNESNHQGNWWEKDEEDESNEDSNNQHHNNWWGR